MVVYVNIAKPSSTNYTNFNPGGRTQYDEPSLTYDDSSTFYDGVDNSAYTNISKPVGTSYTNIAKPT